MTMPLYRTFLTHKSRTITMHGHKVHHNNATLQPPHHCALAILSAPPVPHAVYSPLLQRHWRGSTASGTGTQQLSLWSWHRQEAASCHVRTHMDTRAYVLTRYTQHISSMLFIKIAVALGAAFSPEKQIHISCPALWHRHLTICLCATRETKLQVYEKESAVYLHSSNGIDTIYLKHLGCSSECGFWLQL